MKAYERLLSYVKIFTPSSEETGTSPSTQYQLGLARLLFQELKELSVEDADVDEHCYVYGHIPATRGYESRQKLGFIAHMDTVSDFCDHPVTPVVTPNYDGRELVLGTSGRILSPKMFPHLSRFHLHCCCSQFHYHLYSNNLHCRLCNCNCIPVRRSQCILF